ncbi:MAG: hypothetical protein ACRDRV_14085 [Pseudonocardiaceae bacterium]
MPDDPVETAADTTRVAEVLYPARAVLLQLDGDIDLSAVMAGWQDRVDLVRGGSPDPPAAAVLVRPGRLRRLGDRPVRRPRHQPARGPANLVRATGIRSGGTTPGPPVTRPISTSGNYPEIAALPGTSSTSTARRPWNSASHRIGETDVTVVGSPLAVDINAATDTQCHPRFVAIWRARPAMPCPLRQGHC